jgi:hypothetical protein
LKYKVPASWSRRGPGTGSATVRAAPEVLSIALVLVFYREANVVLADFPATAELGVR